MVTYRDEDHYTIEFMDPRIGKGLLRCFIFASVSGSMPGGQGVPYGLICSPILEMGIIPHLDKKIIAFSLYTNNIHKSRSRKK